MIRVLLANVHAILQEGLKEILLRDLKGVVCGGACNGDFPCFQELLTDVARHANASQVDLRLSNKDSGLVLEVHDNGLEIAEEKRSRRGSLGITGMRECGLPPSANKSRCGFRSCQ